MTEVGGQDRQQALCILVGPIPRYQRVGCESVSHVMQTWPVMVGYATQTDLLGIRRRKFDESLRHPNDCPSWKRTDRRRLLVPPNDVWVVRGSQQVLCKSMRAKARVETCQTWRSG